MPKRNLTPHQMGFLIKSPDGERIVTLPPSGNLTRLVITNSEVGSVDDIPVVCPEEGKVTGLPDPEPGVILIASSMVAKAVKRPDVMSPDTTERGVVRDGSGQVVAVRNLQSFAPPAEVKAFLEEYRRLNSADTAVNGIKKSK